ncbi:polysaccharide pyruvyl transferase [Paenibacillus yonginensis]|uniref:Polysaccharide pyruvyl transferase n=1 Tax=Paenibacillus yonginensis TaxID=1462996 RepID=A0A1B1N3Y6_9BACL|nr:polysaccharide pyruvyl transferase CsaB [Paenibacillus yonginensis]ANS76129.1 polysaccharide pyruvyl transferase [Paenibacillus yonginensis]
MVASATRKIVLSGYYGFRNSGDEAVLRSILTALDEEGAKAGITFEPIVLSADPEWTTKMYKVRAVPRMKLSEVRKAIQESDGLISGGGSLLQDATGPASVPYYLGIIKLAQWLGKPTFVYAQGVGPVNRKLFHRLIASVFKKCRYISVRDMESAELLHTMGVKQDRIEVVPDPVMGMRLPEETEEAASAGAAGAATGAGAGDADQPAPAPEATASAAQAQQSGEEAELPVIGISVRFWNKERAELTALADGLAQLARQRSVHLRFLPFHLPSDEEASRFCMGRIGDLAGTGSRISMAPATDNPQDMLREVDGCSLLVGMRLHSLIYAASRSVPLLGISYDPKIDHFLARLGSVPVGTSDQLSAEKLAAKAQHLLGSRGDWQKQHSGQIERLKREVVFPAQRIADYFVKDKG